MTDFNALRWQPVGLLSSVPNSTVMKDKSVRVLLDRYRRSPTSCQYFSWSCGVGVSPNRGGHRTSSLTEGVWPGFQSFRTSLARVTCAMDGWVRCIIPPSAYLTVQPSNYRGLRIIFTLCFSTNVLWNISMYSSSGGITEKSSNKTEIKVGQCL